MKYLKLLTGLLTVLLLSACAHLVHLDRGQDFFNKAASMENASRLDGSNLGDAKEPSQINDTLLSEQNPEFYYKLAYAELERALTNKANLKRDGALGTTLMLKALCQWKLGLDNKAVLTSGKALDAIQNSEVKLTRDEAVMRALPGLIASDNAFEATNDFVNWAEKPGMGLASGLSEEEKDEQMMNKIMNFYRENVFDPSSGQADIELALEKLESAKPGKHPVRTYLVVSQLASVNTWGDVLSKLNEAPLFQTLERSGQKEWLDKEYECFCCKRQQYLEELKSLTGEDNPVYKKWNNEWLRKPLECNNTPADCQCTR